MRGLALKEDNNDRNKRNLENAYKQYISSTISAENWAKVRDLSQPSALKKVPTKTSYYTSE